MFKLLKFIFTLLILGVIAFAFWFIPKYNFIHKNPQYCVDLTNHLYYCGADSHLEELYSIFNTTQSSNNAAQKIKNATEQTQKALQK